MTIKFRAAPTFLLVSGGRIALLAAWFLATRLLINTLGPVGFGLYFLCQSVIRVMSGCIGDPIDMAVMRQAPLLLRTDKPQALQLIRSAFWLRVSLAIFLLLIALAFPRYASKVICHSPTMRGIAILTIAGVLGDFLLRSALGFFQVSERFGRFLIVDAVWQLSRVIVVVILATEHRLTGPTAIAMYVIAPYVAFIAAWPLLPRNIRRLARPQRHQLHEMLGYTSWIAIGMGMTALYERLDVFVLSHYRGNFEVGIYGGAVFLAAIPDFLDGILQTVLAPKIAPAYTEGKFNQLQLRYLTYAVPSGTAVALGAIFLGNWGVLRFFSHEYINCVPAFKVLIISTLFNLVFVTLPSALVSFIAPRRQVVCTGVGLMCVAAGSLIFIPAYGAIGAAITMLTARLIVGSLILIEARRLTRRSLPSSASQVQ